MTKEILFDVPGGRKVLIGRWALFLVLVCLLSAMSAAAEEPLTVVHVFSLSHAAVRDVSAAVQPLLSADGSITVHPAKGRVTVRDTQEIIDRVAKVVERIDRAPEPFRLRIELLEGSNAGFSIPGELEVDPRLKRMFPFKAYRALGKAEVKGLTGDDATLDLGDRFRVRLTALDHRQEDVPYGLPDRTLRLHIQPLVLEQIHGEKVREILRTRVLLSVNQEVFIGAGGKEDSSRGIVLILKALPGTAK